MGTFTLEPPRRDVVLHLGFENVYEDSVLDMSPQANTGSINGEPDTVPGPVGGAIELDARRDEHVRIAHDDSLSPTDGISIMCFVYLDEIQPDGTHNLVSQSSSTYQFQASGGQLSFTFDDGGSTHTVSASGVLSNETWHHVAVSYDGSNMVLYVDEEEVGRTGTGASIATNTNDVYIGNNSSGTGGVHGAVADVRMFRRGVTAEEVGDVRTIGTQHNSIRTLEDTWDNPGIPFYGNNEAFAGALAEEKDVVKRQLDYILDARHVNEAGGEQLDSIGEGFGIRRKSNESDAKYRARIKGEIASGRSDGTFDDIMAVAMTVLDTTLDRLDLTRDLAANPGECELSVRTTDLEETPLTTTELENILEDAVIGGHRITVVERGPRPFTVIADGQANDPTLGLTDDGSTIGGSLVSDV